MEKHTLLAVDLDGSLIFTDLLYESFVRLVFSQPWLILCLPLWLSKGIANLKSEIAKRVDLDASALPYNHELIDWLTEEKSKGRELVLCTGSNQKYASAVFEHLGLFTSFIASDRKTNLTGSKKALKLTEQFGERGFSYLGNEHKDLKIWKHCKTAVVVSADKSLFADAEKVTELEAKFPKDKLSLKVLLKGIRIHQWSKNALIFVPLFTAHKIFDPIALGYACLAFLAFGMVASATYLLNDLSDLDSDRLHWKKKERPLASGKLSISGGLITCGVLLTGAFLVALFLPIHFIYVLCLYIAVTLGYSFWFKRLQTVDIVVLASLYTVRLFAGSAAVAVSPSFWLLGFSMFIFLCLAIVKRISEIQKKIENDPSIEKLSGRGYFVSDLPVLSSLGSASGMVAILVFAMYVNSPEVVALYKSPMVLWAGCPIIGYWIIRVLIMTSRGEIDEDPISFAIKDRRSWAAGFAAFIVILFAWLVEV